MINFLSKLGKSELEGKKVLLRVDFNVPLDEFGDITDNFRLKRHLETIEYLLNNGARVAMVSHIDAIDTFKRITEEIREALNKAFFFVDEKKGPEIVKILDQQPLVLLENIRQHTQEAENDAHFAKQLALGFDLYVNDAFAVSHRAHASVSAITKDLPSYGGFLMEKEISSLSQAIAAPLAGKVIVLGGAKISTKLPVIQNFLDKAEKILIGGALANNLFKARGIKVGASVIDESVTTDIQSDKIIIPFDVRITDDSSSQSVAAESSLRDFSGNELIVDLGPKSTKKFEEIILRATTVIWNGPMGLFEREAFAIGTRAIAEAVAKAEYSIIGGGETISAISKWGMLDNYDFVSTGGGAMLEFLAGTKLPGLVALGYYD